MSEVYLYDKDKIKKDLTIEQIFEIVSHLGGNPSGLNATSFCCDTICHNEIGEGSHKLYYYENSKGFFCYTGCGYMDIYELIARVNNLAENYKPSNISETGFREWELFDSVNYIVSYFNLSIDQSAQETQYNGLEDWKILKKYEKINSMENKEQRVELNIFNKSLLIYLPKPRISLWEEEGMTHEVLQARGICYNPISEAIVIPHFNIDNELIGIRERTLVQEYESNGKYKPSIIGGKMYNHPLSFNLYNLNNSKDNIKIMQKVIVFESEKSCLLYASYFGAENDISVACCGSSLINYQVKLLIASGAKEIIIAFDKQFQESHDKEWDKLIKNFENINNKYSGFAQISFMFDKGELLNYKDSPIDQGKETFMELFNNRIYIN